MQAGEQTVPVDSWKVKQLPVRPPELTTAMIEHEHPRNIERQLSYPIYMYLM